MNLFNGVLRLGAASAFILFSCAASQPAEKAQIDLTLYELTFEDEFDKLDVSGTRCDSRWIAHTPWNGDFGAAQFVDPSRGFPFTEKDGVLRIEAKKEEGRWRSGLLSARNGCGEGFAQKFGYFEIRTKLPRGDGFWPAFWLIGIDRSRFTAEIDVFEHHGVRADRFTNSIHVHPRADGVKRSYLNQVNSAPGGVLASDFNTYGVSVEDDDTIFYFNGAEVWRTPTLDELKQPLFILFNLAMVEDEISAATPESAHMLVDYVRVYTRKE